MAKRNRLTNNTDESDISSLLSGDVVFSIPFFQRSYKWKPERIARLNQDILTIVDEKSESHFLGALILHGRSSNPADPRVFDVIDGQQRITTLFIYIAAAVRVLAEIGEPSEAAGLFLKYIAIPRDTNLHSNLKLHPCKDDRKQFDDLITDLLSAKGLKEKLVTLKLKRLPVSGGEKGPLRSNYRSALRFFRSQAEQGGVVRLREVYQAMLECVSVVQIDVWDPTNGPKIFDSLNSRQEPMTIGDLVRNEIFAKVADEHPDEIDQIDQHHWQPFYRKFQDSGQNLFDGYFFPYGLIFNPNLKKSEVYGKLRDHWRDLSEPKEIIGQLSRYQDAFIDIATGKNRQLHPKPIANLFRNLYLAGAPGSTYPFLMQISEGVRDKSTGEKEAKDSLELIESFLVRRAACGHEPTGLHAVFKKLWTDCDGQPSRKSVEDAIRAHKTVVWPSNEAFKDAIRTRPLYGASVTKYLLREYDRGLAGDQPDNVPWIEHVLPQSPVKEWYQVFTKDEHAQAKDLLANLIPLSKEMNVGLSNQVYDEKRSSYADDSMFKSARKFAQDYADWNPSFLRSRGDALADWAAARWPY